MIIRLNNLSKKTFRLMMTNNPVTKPYQSPMPTGKVLSDDMSTQEQEEITSHKNYSPSTLIEFKPGINEFKNEEWAEYIYATYGNPEDAGNVIYGDQRIPITNQNIVIEVDEKGEEIKTNLYKKYRINKSPATIKSWDQSLFKIPQ